MLDAGCGEGETLERLGGLIDGAVTGIDLNPESVEFAAARIPSGTFRVADLTDLPFEDDSFDLVFCLEVLEHIPDPAPALAELARVCRGDIVLSVPSEPWFRLGSLARGKYLEDWGNHPEHVNHWNPRSFRDFLAEPDRSRQSRAGDPMAGGSRSPASLRSTGSPDGVAVPGRSTLSILLCSSASPLSSRRVSTSI